ESDSLMEDNWMIQPPGVCKKNGSCKKISVSDCCHSCSQNISERNPIRFEKRWAGRETQDLSRSFQRAILLAKRDKHIGSFSFCSSLKIVSVLVYHSYKNLLLKNGK